MLPWWPIRGVYVLLETGASPPTHLIDVEGVAGVWSATSQSVDARLASAPAGQTISYCFLDDDPVLTAKRLRPVLQKRWTEGASNRCSPRRFTPWCRMSGTAMCRRRAACESD